MSGSYPLPTRGTLFLAGLFLVLGTLPAQAQETRLGLEDVVRITLKQNYTIRAEREQVEMSQGALRAAAGTFDPQIQASLSSTRDNTLYTIDQQQLYQVSSAESGISTYRVGISKQFHSGLTISPGAEMSRTDAFTFDSAPIVRTRANVVLTYPLLRGGGLNMASARVQAAEQTVQASELDLRHVTSQGVYDAVTAYWTYLAAHRSLQILTESEQRAARLLKETEALVEGGERPLTDLDQLQANLADKMTARINAEQRRFEARQQLGLVMGLQPEQAGALPDPTETLPDLGASMVVPPREVLVAQAVQRRMDLQSLRRQEQAAQTMFRASRDEVQPRFDVQVDIGYAGLSEGNLHVGQHFPIAQNQLSGASGSVALIYNWAAGNRSARGALDQQEASYRQRQVVVANLTRRIDAGVTVALQMLQSSSAELSQIREAVGLYRKAVDNEKKKLRLGMSTLFDVTTVEDRLTSALLGEVSARQRYAQALVRIRFETGLLMNQDGDLGAQIQNLTTIPLQPDQP